MSFIVLQDQWYRRAQLALDKGEEELARDALRRKKAFSDNAAMLKKQLDQHTRASGQLMTNIRCAVLTALHVMHDMLIEHKWVCFSLDMKSLSMI